VTGTDIRLVPLTLSKSSSFPMILILTAGYGEGHNAAARGLSAACSEIGVEAQVVDLCGTMGDAFYQYSRRAYLELINRTPGLWRQVYALVDHLPLISCALPVFRKMQAALDKLITKEQPSAIISVYPLYGYLINALYPEGTPRLFSFHTLVTDSITINSIWHRCPSDTFLVANVESARVVVAAGVPEQKVHTFGFPVTPRFAAPHKERPAPGERGERPRVLFMVNSRQSAAPGIVSTLLQNGEISLTVTIGRDNSLRDQIQKAAHGRPVEIHGWTEQMPELLMSHHLLIGKAGGAAVQEAIAACTPMIITQVVPGQEEGNARLLVENRCGSVCRTADEIAANVARLFADGGREQNVRRLSRPDAALQIARFVVAMEGSRKRP
jgi:processive 1,2-diacylglycerol beta-glucosyltransferase